MNTTLQHFPRTHGAARRRWIFTAVLWVAAAFTTGAADVVFRYVDFVQEPQQVRRVNIYPLSYGPSETNLMTADRRIYTNDNTGELIISNMLGGSYRVEFSGAWITTTNWFTFPSTNGLLNAADHVVAPISAFGVVAYSQQQADGRFVRSLSGRATNLTVIGTLTFGGVSLTNWPSGGGSGDPVNLGALAENYLWVRPSGDDTTGQRGRPDKPFQTIRAAQTNAIPGDVIWVLPGWYEEHGLGRDFVTYALHSQAIIGPPTSEQYVFAITNATVAVFGGMITNNINTNATSWLIYGTNATFTADSTTIIGRLRFTGTNSVALKNCILLSPNWLSVNPDSPTSFTDIQIWGGRHESITPYYNTNSARVVGITLLDSP